MLIDCNWTRKITAIFFDYDSSDQCMKKFLNQLRQEARDI